jgi:hypothetical protein
VSRPGTEKWKPRRWQEIGSVQIGRNVLFLKVDMKASSSRKKIREFILGQEVDFLLFTFSYNKQWHQYQQTLAICNLQFRSGMGMEFCTLVTTHRWLELWLRSLLGELTGEEPKIVKLFVDNKSTIALVKNPVFHGRSKHIDTRFHFIRELGKGPCDATGT